MKRIFLIISLFLFTILLTNSALVFSVFAKRSESTEPGELRFETARESKEMLKEKIKNKKVALSGTITSLSTSQLTLLVTKGEFNGKSIVVNITNNTKLFRRFGGKSDLAEFSVNDEINVLGKWTDDIKTAFTATSIRNLSIQKRFGAFVGTVGSIGTGSFILNTLQRRSQTVTVSANTKLVDHREQTIVFSDLKVADRVRVKGLWDKKNNTITKVMQVKNFSLPVKSNVPSPTP
ncbi:hypothetical protein HY030_03430 [Candidatus Gottesmanbacteria bacterium]|nr:hypothetical protein [Candidatus Gottesmanbacteria bacterium]